MTLTLRTKVQIERIPQSDEVYAVADVPFKVMDYYNVVNGEWKSDVVCMLVARIRAVGKEAPMGVPLVIWRVDGSHIVYCWEPVA